MSGLLRRIRRPGAAEENRTEPTAVPDPAHGSAPESPAPSEDGQRLPAGTAPEDVERRSVTGRRSKLRRRARFLHRARELALRDLGGLVYEARRREQDPGKLAEEKVQKLIALDTELNELDAALGATRGETVLREPGVGGTCARCGELHGSDATFCSHCGANLAEAAREAAEADRRAAAEKAAAERKAAEKAEADKAEAERQAAEKAEAEKAAAAQPSAETAAEEQPTEAQPAADAADQPTAPQPAADAADQPTAPQPAADAADQPTEAQPAADAEPAVGNGRIETSEAPTEVAGPATNPDRRA